MRKLLLGSLVAAFGIQTALVYTDDTADSYQTLSEAALRGRRVWHRYNCQSCHQIHGFGGFLGPDLTNAGPRLTPERMTEVLTEGNAQMPAFHLDADQIEDVHIFLDELSEMGVGVARKVLPVSKGKVMAAVQQQLAEQPVDEAVARGHLVFSSHCNVCHVPLQATALGLQTAPDLTTVHQRLDDAAIRATIVDGRVDRGMPAWPLPGTGVDDVMAFLAWMRDVRAELCDKVGGVGEAQPLPWWEYK